MSDSVQTITAPGLFGPATFEKETSAGQITLRIPFQSGTFEIK
jgi:hypothetical protein